MAIVPHATKRPKILVVDDDVGLLVLMAESLRGEGFDVSTAGSGTAALAALRTQPPDLMLLDLKLMDFGGPALLERLRRESLLVPFIVVTGQGDEKAAVEIMKQGALDYVMKDTGLLDLLPAVVKRALSTVERDRSLTAAQEEAQRLEHEIIEIGESERRRIGEDLHDGLGQQLTAIELACAALKEDAARSQPEMAQSLERIGKMLREAIAQTRFLARGLVPVNDEPDALRIGLAQLAERTNSVGRMRCSLECPEPIQTCNWMLVSHLYRIAQEAVNNAMKHSEADEVVIHLSQADGTLQLKISDNGKGLPANKHRGLGLEVMRHRASVIGATFSLVSKRGHGVAITCTVPLPA